jgi:hypothetical protein
MTTANFARRVPEVCALPAEPVLEVCLVLVPGMDLEVRLDRCEGQIPLLDIRTGRAHLLISFDAVDAKALDAGHAALAEEFAAAACGLRDELRRIAASRST